MLCLKLSYLNDKEQSYKEEIELNAMRKYLEERFKHLQVIPLLLMYFLENKIARHYSFGKLFKTKAHLLTTANIIYQVIVTNNNLQLETHGPPTTAECKAQREQRDSLASYVGFATFFAAFACIAVAIVRTRFMQGKSWDNVSVRCGLFLVKACMLIGGNLTVFVYFCLVL